MQNQRIEYLKTLVGKNLSESPSPVGCWLNGKLVEIEYGKAVVQYVVRKEMTNPLGTLQGGVFAVMMDDTLGIAVYSLGEDKLYLAVNFYVDFLESLNEGDVVNVEAKIVRKGNTILNVEIIATTPDYKIAAIGRCNLVIKQVEGLVLPRYKGMEQKFPGVNFLNTP